MSVAFDGTNYLVIIDDGCFSNVGSNNPGNIGVQFVSQSGPLVGSKIPVGNGFCRPHFVAYDGTNYLMVWGITGAALDSGSINGQRIDKNGNLLGTAFQITSWTPDNGDLAGIAYGGEKYLVVYFKQGTANSIVYGRLVSPDGSMGGEIQISTGFGEFGLDNVVFDGTNFLVVWTDDVDDSTVKGRFVSPAGTLGTEFTINASTSPSDNPLTVAFDGTNYLVVWMDEVGGFDSGEWDLFGQLVDTSGNLVGGVINISTAPGEQFSPFIAFDGTNYLVTWTDMRNDASKNFACDAGEGTCFDIYGQYISKSGTLVGSEFVINADSGNQLGGAVAFAGGKYLALVNTGVSFDSTGEFLGGDVIGTFITP